MRPELVVRLHRSLVDVRPERPVTDGAIAGEAAEAAAAERLQRQQEAQRAAEREAIGQVLGTLTEVARSLDLERRQLLAEMQHVAVELAVAVAGRLVHERIQAGEFPIENVVRHAVEHLDAKRPVSVRLHPDDLALLAQRMGDAPLADSADVQLAADATLARGDCRAEAGELSVLAQLEVQLADLRRHLLGSLGNAEIERRKAQPGDRSLRRFPDRRQTA